ncbi:MAG: hypothetical protein AAF673_04865, partial [Pseudomonadota bacterium]
ILYDLKNYEGLNPRKFIVRDFGLSNDFMRKIKEIKIDVRYPVEFFDNEFRYEEKSSTIMTRIKPPTKRIRIDQPYSGGTKEILESNRIDILTDVKAILEENTPHVTIVVGPAGIGKTMFFEALITDLYEKFNNKKRAKKLFPRPIPFIPEFIQYREQLHVENLVDTFLESHIPSKVSRTALEWMLQNGYCTWLFDGLDEIYSGDENFFEYIAEVMSEANGQSHILICARDSLLTTSESLIDFIHDYENNNEFKVNILRLEKWNEHTKKAYSAAHFRDKNAAHKFFKYVTDDSMDSITDLPYFIELIRNDIYKPNKDAPKIFDDEFELLKHCSRAYIKREEKSLRINYFEDGLTGLEYLLEEIAFKYIEASLAGIPLKVIEKTAEHILVDGITESEISQTIQTLVRLAFFTKGTAISTVSFEHEIMAEYFAASRYYGLLSKDGKRVVTEVFQQRPDFSKSYIGRYILNNLRKDDKKLDELSNLIKESHGRTFTTLLKLFLATKYQRSAIKDYHFIFQGKPLDSVSFVERDLSKMSFAHSNLTLTEYISCDLRDSNFDGAWLKGTRFLDIDPRDFETIEFGRLERFEYITVGKNTFTDREKFANWLSDNTGKKHDIEYPCPTALQLNQLFLKYLRPDGALRQLHHKKYALLKGTKYPGGASAKDCLDACLKFGYLDDSQSYGRFSRVSGKKLLEMQDYVSSWKLSKNMKNLLDSICKNANCNHV